MKNCKGFSLIEVLAALSIFTIAVTTALPFLIRVYEERTAIQEERKAFEILQNRTQIWLMSEDGTVPNGEEITVGRYTVTVNDTSKHTLKMCISWTGSNERGYKKCSYAKKQRNLADSH